ncbi:phospholipase A1-like [Photinus pyralis]|uniref:phospholipase A1-like n=1 Tax=Photinus pyralis TaxID=7054 RepID=UPI00126741CD|nr:phospholipase A1-like [Photinus pyralis]XP_031341369.1 phospholipase A1-like [Photinus pyralis]
MAILFVSALLCSFIHYSTGALCSYNFTLDDLPNSIVGEVASLLAGNLLNEFNECSEISYDGSKVDMWLYTRDGPPTGRNVRDIDTSILKGRKTILTSHGFLCSHNNNLMPELKDAYLKRYDANVIAIDWSAYSKDYYANVYCNLPRIAQTVAQFLCKADYEHNIEIRDLHMVGHSMGGQLAGLIGQETKAQCSKILGRISALDPAGPLYTLRGADSRLDASDAKLVMVIHTNMGILGYVGNCGTVDFYPDFGAIQSGCSIFDSPSSNPLNALLYPAACSHLRAVDYMIESLSSNRFNAKSCLMCTGCIANPMGGSKAVMGEDVTFEKDSCAYYMYINKEAPYAQGPI